MAIPVTRRIGKAEKIEQADAVDDNGFLFLRTDTQGTAYLLQVERQGECGTGQLDELQVGTVEPFAEDVDIDDDIEVSVTETLHAIGTKGCGRAAVNSGNADATGSEVAADVLVVRAVNGVNDSLAAMGIALVGLVKGGDGCTGIEEPGKLTPGEVAVGSTTTEAADHAAGL